MICLFSSIKEFFTGQPLIPFQGRACKARKSVIVVPCTCLPDSNNLFLWIFFIFGQIICLDNIDLIQSIIFQ